MHEIISFKAAYHQDRNIGFIRIFFEDRSFTFRDLALDKFNALISVLKNPYVFLDSNGWITTDPAGTN